MSKDEVRRAELRFAEARAELVFEARPDHTFTDEDMYCRCEKFMQAYQRLQWVYEIESDENKSLVWHVMISVWGDAARTENIMSTVCGGEWKVEKIKPNTEIQTDGFAFVRKAKYNGDTYWIMRWRK